MGIALCKMHYCSIWRRVRSEQRLPLWVMPQQFKLDALLAVDQLSGLQFGKNFGNRGSWVAPCSGEAVVPCGLGVCCELWQHKVSSCPLSACCGPDPAHGVLHLCLRFAISEACSEELTCIWSKAWAAASAVIPYAVYPGGHWAPVGSRWTLSCFALGMGLKKQLGLALEQRPISVLLLYGFSQVAKRQRYLLLPTACWIWVGDAEERATCGMYLV